MPIRLGSGRSRGRPWRHETVRASGQGGSVSIRPRTRLFAVLLLGQPVEDGRERWVRWQRRARPARLKRLASRMFFIVQVRTGKDNVDNV